MDCTASTEYGVQDIFPCTKAINKNPDDSWVTNDEAVGAWIRISLDKTYLVTRIQLRHRARGRNHEKFKGIKVEFSAMEIAKIVYFCPQMNTIAWKDI